jgi:hypothetical protein
VKSCQSGFSPERYLRSLADAVWEDSQPKSKRRPPAEFRASDIEHPELYQQLKAWRTAKAAELGVAPFQVMHQRVLIQVAVRLPDHADALQAIKGVGPKTIESCGEELLGLVAAYRRQHGIEDVQMPPAGDPAGPVNAAATPAGPSSTKQISLDLLNRGMDVAAIAAERGLAVSTIEGHLRFFVANGQLDIDRLLPPAKQRAIEDKLSGAARPSLSEVKQALGGDFSYGEIKLVIAHRNQRSEKAAEGTRRDAN